MNMPRLVKKLLPLEKHVNVFSNFKRTLKFAQKIKSKIIAILLQFSLKS